MRVGAALAHALSSLGRPRLIMGVAGTIAVIAALTFFALRPVAVTHAQTPPTDAPASEAPAKPDPDRSGNGTGSGADLAGVAPGTLTADDFTTAQTNEPFAVKLADLVNQNRLGINFTW